MGEFMRFLGNLKCIIKVMLDSFTQLCLSCIASIWRKSIYSVAYTFFLKNKLKLNNGEIVAIGQECAWQLYLLINIMKQLFKLQQRNIQYMRLNQWSFYSLCISERNSTNFLKIRTTKKKKNKLVSFVFEVKRLK